jgi:hypothetical protein
MGKALRIQLFKILVLFLALNCTNVFQSHGQVPLVDLRSFEISFTPGESVRERSGVLLSMQEAKRMSGLDIEDGQPFQFTSEQERQNGFYYVETQGGVSLGRYYHTNGNQVLSQLPIRNGTPSNISGISLAYDFVYFPVGRDSDVSFQLSYRVNNGEWISPSGGFFNSGMLQGDEEGWNTFSMQIYLDRLYLLPNDVLSIRWTATGDVDRSDFIPIAVQKVDLFATEATERTIEPGSLIISEIMTSFETDAGYLEYVEVYNSTEESINLKGFVMSAGNSRVVVQDNLNVEPYDAVVLAGFRNGNERYDSFADYRYTERILGDVSGRLTLSLDGEDVARALYESQRPGTSIQINHLENAFDGYSGLSNFVSASNEWNSTFSGTPGNVESEQKLYGKSLSKAGWYLLDPPGDLSEINDMDVVGNFTSLFNTDLSETTENSRPPYIYRHSEGSSSVKLYASGRSSGQDVANLADDEQNQNERPVASIDVHNRSAINHILNRAGDQAYPALLTWDASTQAFKTVWRETDRLEPWNSYMVSKKVATSQADQDEQSKISESWTGLSRFLQLKLVSDSETEAEVSVFDQSMIGFWEPGSRRISNGQNFDLPKLWIPLLENSQEMRSPMIYLKSAENGLPVSYINFPFSPQENLRIPVGLKLPSSINRVTVQWDFIDTLPERWEMEFVDSEIGESINMRDETSYTFSERSELVREGMGDPNRSFQQIESNDYSRFFIRLSPTGDLGMLESETETPEGVQLKQNYPNPFNPTTTIGFYLPVDSDVRIGVYNVVGQQVGQLVDDRLNAGDHTVSWNALDMPSGVYIVQLEAMNTVQTRKITLIK